MKHAVRNIMLSLLFLQAPLIANAATLEDKIHKALSFAQKQLETHAQRTGPQRYTCYTDTQGKWKDTGMQAWCSGFSGGLMWMMYDYTKDEKWANYGRDWTNSIRARATASDQDTSFQIFNAFGYALRHAFDALSEAEKRDYQGVLQWATHTFTT